MANSFFGLLPFEFASPIFLLGAAAGMFVFGLFSLRRKPKQQYSDFRMLGKRGGKGIRVFIWILVLTTTLSLFGALARPEVLREEVIPVYARDFVVIFDFSISMDHLFNPEDQPQESKFNIGRDATFSFIEDRTEDRFGFVLFAEEAYGMPLLEGSKHILENPALKDGLAIGTRTLLKQLEYRATNTEKGILSAITIFEKMSVAETQIIILMTDLADPWPEEFVVAMKEAERKGVDKAYILYLEDARPAVASSSRKVKATLESELGEFVKIFDIKEESRFQEIYSEIDKLEKSKTSEKVIERRESIVEYFIATALASFILLGICSFTLWKKIP